MVSVVVLHNLGSLIGIFARLSRRVLRALLLLVRAFEWLTVVPAVGRAEVSASLI